MNERGPEMVACTVVKFLASLLQKADTSNQSFVGDLHVIHP